MFQAINMVIARSLFPNDHEGLMSAPAIFVEQLPRDRFGPSALIICTYMQNPHSDRIHGHTTKPEMISHFSPVHAKVLVGNASPDRCKIARIHRGSGFNDRWRPTFHAI